MSEQRHEQRHRTGVAIVGAGLAGLCTALELLDHGQTVVLLDRDAEERAGGLARLAFGGMLLVGTPLQRLNGIRDTPELALRDWLSTADFGPEDVWPRRWAEAYVERSLDDIYRWLRKLGIGFFPVPHWIERGSFQPGNSVPRWHIVWGTGQHVVETLVRRLRAHPRRERLSWRFGHHVTGLLQRGGQVTGVRALREPGGEALEIEADAVVVASGGINGNLELVRKHWDRRHGPPPEVLLNGAHRYADGALHDLVEGVGGNVTHLEWMWNYAAGIHHPRPSQPLDGLSLIPPKSALWMDCRGRRVGPRPLLAGYDTLDLCRRISNLERQYTWLVLNWRIAAKELAISGAESNPNVRDRKLLAFLRDTLRGNHALVRWLVDECEDVVTARSLGELAERMNGLTGEGLVDAAGLARDVALYDAQIERGPRFFSDDQLCRLAHARQWRGDRARTCRFQKLVDERALPLLAIRCFIVSRKSQGGIQTDLESRVLGRDGAPVPGLWAAGEAAGFGGGGINGAGSLEGTFMSNCVLNGRIAARSIAGVANP